MTAHRNGANHVQGPPPHHCHTSTVAAHTAGTTMVTAAATHARTNPAPTFLTHRMLSLCSTTATIPADTAEEWAWAHPAVRPAASACAQRLHGV
ncbi:hypothetical protein GCM10029964_036690 [Kibdelosporangium lantanae]